MNNASWIWLQPTQHKPGFEEGMTQKTFLKAEWAKGFVLQRESNLTPVPKASMHSGSLISYQLHSRVGLVFSTAPARRPQVGHERRSETWPILSAMWAAGSLALPAMGLVFRGWDSHKLPSQADDAGLSRSFSGSCSLFQRTPKI